MRTKEIIQIALAVVSIAALRADPIPISTNKALGWKEVGIECDAQGKPLHLLVTVTYSIDKVLTTGAPPVDAPYLFGPNGMLLQLDGMRTLSNKNGIIVAVYTLPISSINFFDAQHDDINLVAIANSSGAVPKLILKIDKAAVEKMMGTNNKDKESDFDRILKQKAGNDRP